MDLKEVTDKVSQICDIYVKEFNIRRDDDWFLLKLQEELGELSSAHLKLSQRARTKGDSVEMLHKNFQDEIADVFAFVLLLAQHKNIDIEQALKQKWFKYLEWKKILIFFYFFWPVELHLLTAHF